MARYGNELNFHMELSNKQKEEISHTLTHIALKRNPVKLTSLCVVQRLYLHYPVSGNALTKQISCVNEI